MSNPNSKPMLTAERARELFDYNPATGALTHLIGRNAGLPVGTPDKRGAIRVYADGSYYLAHRLAFLMVTGAFPTAQLDHRNTDPSDNAWSNLREASNAQNSQNIRSPKGRNKLVGAYRHPAGRFMAQIVIGGKAKYLGLHDTPELAHAAYVKAKRAHHPFGTL
jgi:hypothetical protein